MAIGFPVKDDYVTGDVLTAANMNDLSGTLNTLAGVEYAAGKNKIINGAFNVWQRGTSVTASASVDTLIADRFYANRNGTGATVTISQQTFTPGTAPVAGYESQYFYRYAQTVAGTGGTFLIALAQKIEDVRTFAGQTVTMSFFAKADASRVVTLEPYQSFGSGGSSSVFLTTQNVTLTTSWARYSLTFAVPSVAGKTIGAGSFFAFSALGAVNTAQTLDFWGVQVEEGSVATAFQTATGTLQGELAACQRYYYRFASEGKTYASFNTAGYFPSTTSFAGRHQHPVAMRTNPTVLDYANLSVIDSSGTFYAVSSAAIDTNTNTSLGTMITFTVSGATAARYGSILINNNTGAYLGLGAEL
jgi:hypothetical protein